MGFLKFLKKDKKRDTFKDLDLPPAPPPLEGFEDTAPNMPDFAELEKDDISAPREKQSNEEFPKFDFPELEETIPESAKEEVMPDFESLQETEKEPLAPVWPVSTETDIPELKVSSQEGAMGMSQEIPAHEEFAGFTSPMPIPKKRNLQADVRRENWAPSLPRREKERDFEQIIKSGTSMYVSVDKFKVAIGSINLIRSDLRKSEEALMKLENINVTKDRYFEKVRSSLEDLQKKVIFVDKTIFKGE